MILVCYDGSPDAQAAIAHAARLMPGAEATVLTIWEPFADAVMHGGGAGTGGPVWVGSDADGGRFDTASQASALETATEGAERANAVGLVAEGRITSRPDGSGRAILGVAAEVDADVVVLGTRGRGGVKSFLLGSVSHEVVQHADRPVLIIPSPELAEQRRDAGRRIMVADRDHVGRFSEGEEQLPDSAEKDHVGRFSEGEEQLPDSAEKRHVGRFSEGEAVKERVPG